MSAPTIVVFRKGVLPKLPTYIGECCREWPLAVGTRVGRCGLCGERPTFKRADS